MTHFEAAQRFLAARKAASKGEVRDPYELNEPSPSIPPVATYKTDESAPVILPFAPQVTPSRPEPAAIRWTPQARLIDDAKRLGVRLEMEGRTLRVFGPDELPDYEWDALNHGLSEFSVEVKALLASAALTETAR